MPDEDDSENGDTVTPPMPMAVGICDSAEKATEVVERLIAASFRPEEIGVVMRSHEHTDVVPVAHHTRAGRGARMGGALGAVLGLTGAALFAVGAIPGIGIGLVAAGPFIAMLEGAAAGGMIGSAAGATVGFGFWDVLPDFSDSEVIDGKILVGVSVSPERAKEAERLLADAGAKVLTRRGLPAA